MSPLKGAILLPSYERDQSIFSWSRRWFLLLLVTNVLADHLFVQALRSTRSNPVPRSFRQ